MRNKKDGLFLNNGELAFIHGLLSHHVDWLRESDVDNAVYTSEIEGLLFKIKKHLGFGPGGPQMPW